MVIGQSFCVEHVERNGSTRKQFLQQFLVSVGFYDLFKGIFLSLHLPSKRQLVELEAGVAFINTYLVHKIKRGLGKNRFCGPSLHSPVPSSASLNRVSHCKYKQGLLGGATQEVGIAVNDGFNQRILVDIIRCGCQLALLEEPVAELKEQ